MANQLIKAIRESYIVGHPLIPGSPGQPYVPAHTVTVTETQCGYTPTTQYGGNAVGYAWVRDDNGELFYTLVDAQGRPTTGSASTQMTYACRSVTRQINVPEQPYVPPTNPIPAVPAQTILDYNFGWNSGARSRFAFDREGVVSFKVPKAVSGVVAGISDSDKGAGYADIKYAWYFSKGIARVYEQGQQRFYLGAYADGDTFEITRKQGFVTYRHVESNTSFSTAYAENVGRFFIDVSLYSGGDNIYDPAIAQLVGADMILSPLYSFGYDSGATLGGGRSATALAPLVVTAGVKSRGATALHPLTAMGSDRIYGAAAISLAALDVAAEGGFSQPAYAIGESSLMFLMVGATGLTGGIGGAGVSFAPLGTMASGDNVVSSVVSSAAGDAYASFSVSPTADNLVVGFADTATVTAPAEVDHGYLFNDGAVSVIEDGVVVAVIGAFTGGEVFVIERHAGTVYYKIDGTTVHISASPSVGTVYLVEVSTDGAPVDPGAVIDDTLNAYSLKTYGEARITLAPLVAGGSAYEGNTNATLWSSVGVGPNLSGGAEIAVVMNSDLSVSAVLAIKVLVDRAMVSDVDAATTLATQAVINAVMQTTVFAGFGVPVFDTESNAASVWVVNADSFGTTRYENFDFNSFAEIGGRYYGCKTSGLYLLEGDADGTDPIRASIDFGKDNYGSSALKSCPAAYIGVSSTGRMYLKVTANGEEFLYAARGEDDEEMKTQRIDIGKGIRANYLRFELLNRDGCDFELDSVEFAVVALSRRI